MTHLVAVGIAAEGAHQRPVSRKRNGMSEEVVKSVERWHELRLLRNLRHRGFGQRLERTFARTVYNRCACQHCRLRRGEWRTRPGGREMHFRKEEQCWDQEKLGARAKIQKYLFLHKPNYRDDDQ